MSKKKSLNIIMDPDGNPLLAFYEKYKFVGGPYRETEDGIYASVKLDPKEETYSPRAHGNLFVVFYKEHGTAESEFSHRIWRDYTESPSDGESTVRNSRFKDWRKMWGLFTNFEDRDTFFKKMTPAEQDEFIASELNDGKTYAWAADNPGYSKNERKYKHILRTDPAQPLVPLIELANLNDLATGKQCEISDVTQTVYRRTLPMRKKMQTREEVEFDIGGSRTFDGLCYISRTCLLPAKSGNLYFEYLAQFTAANLSVFMLPGQSALDISMRPFLNEIADMLKVDGANAPQSVVEMIESAALGNLNIKISDPDVCNALTLMFTKSEKFLRIYKRLYTDIYGEAVERFNEIQARVTKNNPAAVVSTRQYTATKKGSVAHLPNTATSLWFAISKDIERPLELDVGNYHVVTQLSAGKDYIEMAKLIVNEYIAWLLPRRAQLIDDNMPEFVSAFAAWCAARDLTIEGDQTLILNPYTLTGIEYLTEGVGAEISESSLQDTQALDTEDDGLESMESLERLRDLSTPEARVFNISVQDTADALIKEFEKSSFYTPLEDMSPEDVNKALDRLKEILTQNNIQSRKWTKNNEYRCYIESLSGVYIEIEPYEIIATLVNRERVPVGEPLNTKLNQALTSYDEWRDPFIALLELRDAENLAEQFEVWLDVNDYEVTGMSVNALFGVEDLKSDEIQEIAKAAIDTEVSSLNAQIEESISVGDTHQTAQLEAQRDAAVQRFVEYARGLESGTLIPPPEPVQSLEPQFYEPEDGEFESESESLERVDWDSIQQIPTDTNTQLEIDRLLGTLNVSDISAEVIESLFADLRRRGLGNLESIIHVNKLNGDVYPGEIGGFLEGVAIPVSLTRGSEGSTDPQYKFNERREYVKAIKAFEERKQQANMQLLIEIARGLGINPGDKEDILSYDNVPQFTVRSDYLNEYVERMQPGEIEAIEAEVVELLREFESSRTADTFAELQGRIESLFRHDPANLVYHSYLDKTIEIADREPPIFSHDTKGRSKTRSRFPNYARLQSKAAAVYGERGYVPVIEDPLAGLEDLAKDVSDRILQLWDSDYTELIELYDPDIQFDLLQDRGIDLEDLYLGYKNLDSLPECVAVGLINSGLIRQPPRREDDVPPPPSSGPEYAFTFELTFGDYNAPDFRRCQDMEQIITPSENAALETFAQALFAGLQSIYSLYSLATDIEVDIVYADAFSVTYRPRDVGYIRVELTKGFSQADADSAQEQVCEALARAIDLQEPDLDLDDEDLDAADLLPILRSPTRVNPLSTKRDILDIFQDLEAIARKDGDYRFNLETLRQIYESCVGEALVDSIDDWNLSRYIGESKDEQLDRRNDFADMIGLEPYLPYDVSVALDDEDFGNLLRDLQIGMQHAISSDFTRLENQERLRALIARVYRNIVFPKYFPEDSIRVVHVTREEAEEFTKTHHSLLGESGINRRGLLCTIGAEVDGKLVAIATANSPSGRGANQMREVDLSRVASDGSVKGVSSLLAGIILNLTLEGKLRRETTMSPLLSTFSVLSEIGSTYMALLAEGLRPVSLSVKKKNATGSRKGASAPATGLTKIRWEAGDDAEPANLEIARFLKPSYANEILKFKGIQVVSEPYGDADICLAILSAARVSCSPLEDMFREFESSAKSQEARKILTQYATETLAEGAISDPIRKKTLTKYLKPIKIAENIRVGSNVENYRSDIMRCIQSLQTSLARLPNDVCDKPNIQSSLRAFQKSL